MSKKPLPATPPKFNVGDIVYLVTGGPAMSVSSQNTHYDSGNYSFDGHYKCQWFAGKKLESGTFPEESLTATNPKP